MLCGSWVGVDGTGYDAVGVTPWSWKVVQGDRDGINQEHVAGQGGAKAAGGQEGMAVRTWGIGASTAFSSLKKVERIVWEEGRAQGSYRIISFVTF